MRLLLDTHALIWWDEGHLPRAATKAVQDALEVWVSAASAWEIAIKSALGKIAVRGSVAEAVADYGFSALPITIAHAEAVRTLPPGHKDPFDRLLIAQAQIEDLTILTHDPAFRAYAVAVSWI